MLSLVLQLACSRTVVHEPEPWGIKGGPINIACSCTVMHEPEPRGIRGDPIKIAGSCTAVHEPEPRSFKGDPKSTAAELSQMSFRQSFGGGDAYISYEDNSSVCRISSAGCDGRQSDSASLLATTCELLEVDGCCRSDKGRIPEKIAASVTQLTSDTEFWLSAVSSVKDGTIDCTIGFRTHPNKPPRPSQSYRH